MEVTREFVEAEALRPLWTGDTVSHESVMFLEGDHTARLLYPAEEIYAVLSSDLQTEYEQGKDWALDDGCLVRLPGSRIPAMPLAEYYPKADTELGCFGCVLPGKERIRYGEGDTFIRWQVDVTYRRKAGAGWPGGKLPADRSERFARFLGKMARGEEATVVFYGDSITTGCNSTGTYGRAPYMPSFPQMVARKIAETYGYTLSIEVDPHLDPKDAPTPPHGEKILHYVNTAVGGMESQWGLDHVEENVNVYHPDLVFLAFGMNDGWKSAEEYLRLTRETVEAMQSANPSVDVCLVATMLPHWRVQGFFVHQVEYEDALEVYTWDTPHMAVAPVSSVHKNLLSRKEYYHMAGNNVNHCNDFMARVYAMTLLRTVLG